MVFEYTIKRGHLNKRYRAHLSISCNVCKKEIQIGDIVNTNRRSTHKGTIYHKECYEQLLLGGDE